VQDASATTQAHRARVLLIRVDSQHGMNHHVMTRTRFWSAGGRGTSLA
jgi:hypothetical protein